MKRFFCSLIIIVSVLPALFASAPKRDFRGAWIQTIYQGYDKRSTAENKAYLSSMLDRLEATGINAVFFQVRPRADALYNSSLEPWSASLTGKYGEEPSPRWDPLQFMIEECHARGMELHAWLNPYRGPAIDEEVPSTHLLKLHPERFLKYGKNYYFNPAMQVNRDHITAVVTDLLMNYDVDGIHLDDYFYPYPIAKTPFPDAKDYKAAKTKLSLANWRRQNVDKLIEQLSATIFTIKPWVRFGISPFGIWRNKSADPAGSDTHGLSNYDDLYADVPMWAEKGWIDYQIPQLYWAMDHKSAPYSVLCPWWAKNSRNRHVYIGQDAENIEKFDQLDQKMALLNQFRGEGLDGNCWWYAASLPKIANQLTAKEYKYKALPPEYLWKNVEPTDKPKLRLQGSELLWNVDPNAAKWVVYRFDSKKEIDTDSPRNIVKITYEPTFTPALPGVYVVTALDRANGESSHSNPITVK